MTCRRQVADEPAEPEPEPSQAAAKPAEPTPDVTLLPTSPINELSVIKVGDGDEDEWKQVSAHSQLAANL